MPSYVSKKNKPKVSDKLSQDEKFWKKQDLVEKFAHET